MAVEIPQNLILVAWLSGGITGIVSITYLLLSVLGLIYYFDCDSSADSILAWDKQFWNIVYGVYIRNDDCENAMIVPNITRAYTIFVLVAITLSFSVVNLCTSIALTGMISNNKVTPYLNIYVYAYIGAWVSTLVVDLTLGVHLGMDITYLADQMNQLDIYNPVLEILRQGAFYLMAIAFKGFIIHVIQIVLITLMVVYLCQYQSDLKKDERRVYNTRIINAFEPNYSGFPERETQPEREKEYHHNNIREPMSFPRSDSWHHHGSNHPQHQQQMQPSTSARPFSYLEEIRQPPPPPQKLRVPQPAWSVPAPRVPEPDYSPESPRRLKSVLKPYNM